MSSTAPRPDLQAHETVTRMPFPQVASRLSEILGAKLVAYIAGVSETRAVREWAIGKRGPRPDVESRLRTALILALLLSERDSAKVVQAWFQGMNPQLDDRSPARILRTAKQDDAAREVLAAARAFLIGG